MQPAYLDAVCEGGEWDVLLADKSGRAVAAWPIFLKQKGPWRYVAMPALGRMMGPYLLPEYRCARHEVEILETLLDLLPPGLTAFEQDFNYTATNWLPFYWQGYRQTTRYSYTLDLSDLDAVWKNIKPRYRNQRIRQAKEAVHVTTGCPLLELQRLQSLSFERQGEEPPISLSLMRRLEDALAPKGQREIFWATDLQTGATHSAGYLAWDAHSAYYLMSGDDPALRNSGAGIYLTWEIIRYSSEVLGLKTFDFCGSMMRPIERVRRQFGAEPKPYFRVQKEWSSLWRLGKRLLR
ncbi:MAG TPA: GNAT family N-acetyltransferase [Saprospiraceae bacterium]|nr:GNAT family N-acetyltransferase [Saprospiraceae bacterium]